MTMDSFAGAAADQANTAQTSAIDVHVQAARSDAQGSAAYDHPVDSAAQRLKTARERCGLSLEEIATNSCVSQRYLDAIDAGQYDRLPELTFAVGFVRAYADAVGENPDEVAALFKREIRATADREHERVNVPGGERTGRRVPGWLAPIAGLLGAVATLGWIGGGMLMNAASAPDAGADLAALDAVRSQIDEGRQARREALSVSALLPAAYADDAAVALEDELVVTFEAHDSSWLRLARADGTEIWSGVLQADTTYSPMVSADVTVSLSDAGAVALSVGDKPLPSLGGRGQVIVDAPLALSSAE